MTTTKYSMQTIKINYQMHVRCRPREGEGSVYKKKVKFTNKLCILRLDVVEPLHLFLVPSCKHIIGMWEVSRCYQFLVVALIIVSVVTWLLSDE